MEPADPSRSIVNLELATGAPLPPFKPAPLPPDFRWLAAWTLLGLALRLIQGLWVHPLGANLWSDMAYSFQQGVTLANPHHVLDKWDVVKPRAIGVLGAVIVRWFGQGDRGKAAWALLQVLLSGATLPLAFVGTRRWLGRRTARIALVLLALDPLAISFAGFLMVETYAMFCLALAFALLDPDRPLRTLLSGIALGLAALFKPQVLPLVPPWCLLLLLWPSSGAVDSVGAWVTNRRRVGAALFGVGVLAVVVPEALTVSHLVGRPTLLSAYSGQNFYIGHCNVRLMTMIGERTLSFGVPKVYERNEPWPDVTFKVDVLDSAFYMHEGMKCWRQSFWGTAWWSLQQVLDVFAGWPGSTIDPFPIPGGWNQLPRWYSVILEYVFVPLGLWVLWQRKRELGAWVVFAAPLGAIWALALLFSGDPRYREPFDIFLLGGAAAGLSFLLDRARSRATTDGEARASS